MKISEVIKRLEDKKSQFGDVEVQVCNEAGDWTDSEAVEMVTLKEKTVKVYISG